MKTMVKEVNGLVTTMKEEKKKSIEEGSKKAIMSIDKEEIEKKLQRLELNFAAYKTSAESNQAL